MSCVGILRGATRDIEDLMIPIILWDTLTVGRNENCHFVIDFPFIDQLQCEFTARTQEFDNIVYLTDRSRNGTFLNQTIIGCNRTVVLFPGCIISFVSKHLNFIFIQKQKCPKPIEMPSSFHLKDRKAIVADISLGTGSQAMIYLAYMADRPTEQLVYRAKFSSRTVFISKNEIEILKANRHANVISLITMHDNNMIMPAFPGGSLDQYIGNDEPFTEEESFFIFYQLASGLQYLHKKGIVHRDIKPDNILVSGTSLRSRIVIADFGLAIYEGDADKVREKHGTYGYFAPEVVKYNRFSAKSDCWAAGIILFIMLFGRHPFEEYLNDMTLLTDAILNGKIDYERLEKNDDLELLLSSLLHVDVCKRASLAQCLQSNWILKRANSDFFQEYKEMVLDHFEDERKVWFGEDLKDDQAYYLNNLPVDELKPTYHVDDDPTAVEEIKSRRVELKSGLKINTEMIENSPWSIEDWINAINTERFPYKTLYLNK